MRPIALARGVVMLFKPSMVSYREWEIRRSWLSSREFMGCSKTGGLPGASYREQERDEKVWGLTKRCHKKCLFSLINKNKILYENLSPYTGCSSKSLESTDGQTYHVLCALKNLIIYI